MFGAKSALNPPAGGLSINTASANSLFGNKTPPAAGGLFGSTTNATSGANSGGLFSGLGASNNSNTTSQPQQSSSTAGGLFGNTSTNTSNNTNQTQPQTGSLFSGLGSTNNQPQQQQQSSGGLLGGLGSTSNQQQPSGGLFGGGANSAAKPQTSSLFGNTTSGAGLGQSTSNTNTQQQQQQQTQNTNVIQGVKVDISQLHSTTKFEACEPILKNQISEIDAIILKQITLCNEVSDLLPAIADQGATIPNDVDFVSQKLDNLKHGLENDAIEIDQVRQFVEKDAAEARLGFRAIDALRLPTQWQVSGGYSSSGWWNTSQQAVRGPGRSSAIVAEATADNDGGPANLVEYFSSKADEMASALDKYKGNMKEVEEHLGYVENLLMGQIADFMASRNRGAGDINGADGGRKKGLGDLTAALGEVENSILAVAGRVGGVREEVQETIIRQASGGSS